MQQNDGDELVVLRCRSCGDTFSAHGGEAARCPSCGGTEHDVAHEPLL